MVKHRSDDDDNVLHDHRFHDKNEVDQEIFIENDSLPDHLEDNLTYILQAEINIDFYITMSIKQKYY